MKPDSDEAERLLAYVGSKEFARRCAHVSRRQRAGEDFSEEGLAQALNVPLWFVHFSLCETAAKMAPHVHSAERPQ